MRIDHIGSTSIPGLGAKDIIDIQVTVRELTPLPISLLQDVGFVYVKAHSSDHVPAGESPEPSQCAKQYFCSGPSRRQSHIHIRVHGKRNQKYALLFRDYLRSNPNACKTIELIKLQLAKHHAEDVETYYDIKDPVYDLIWEAAKLWANSTLWSVNLPRDA